jgi:hypothetical protein
MLLYASATLAIRDIDLYWHLRAGRELLSGVRANAVGSEWSFAPDPEPWVTTQWLSEVVLYLAHSAGGWPAMVGYRTVTAALCVAILAHSTLKGRPAALAAFPFLAASAAAISFSQERPNQATLIGAAALGPVLLRGLTGVHLPRWWLILPATWAWANLHGGWVLVPCVLALIALGRALDHGLADSTGRRALWLSVVSVVIGTLTPAGVSSTIAVLRFSGATDAIQEWGRTAPLDGPGLLTVAMLAMFLTGWARSTVPDSEAVATVLLLLFSWTALRNVAPALLILAPLVAHRLCVAFPKIGRDPEPRWSAPLGIAVACGLLVLGLATMRGRELLPIDKYPVTLAGQISDLTGSQRVLNDYDVAGLVLFFADPEDQVGIDGRSDKYGAEYIDTYLDLTHRLPQDWPELLSELDPTAALLTSDSPIAHVLVTERGWREIGRENHWILLEEPSQ